MFTRRDMADLAAILLASAQPAFTAPDPAVPTEEEAAEDVSVVDCLYRITLALERIASAQESPRSTSSDDWLRLTLTRIAKAIESGGGGLRL